MQPKLFFPVLLISLITACSVVVRDDLGKRVSDPMELRIRDVIRVVTIDIEDFRFRLTGVTEQAIEGEDISIPFVKVRELEVITPVQSSSNEPSAAMSVVIFILDVGGLILISRSSPSSGPSGRYY